MSYLEGLVFKYLSIYYRDFSSIYYRDFST
jgi:hypothetical protein